MILQLDVSMNNSFNLWRRNRKWMEGAPRHQRCSWKPEGAADSNQHVRAGPHGLHGKLPPSRHLRLSNRSTTRQQHIHSWADESLTPPDWKSLSGHDSRAVSDCSSDVLLVRTQRSEGFLTTGICRCFLHHRLHRSISRCWTAGWKT